MVKSFVKRYVPGKRNAVHTDGPSYAGDAVLLWGFLGLAQDVGRVESPISSVPPLLLWWENAKDLRNQLKGEWQDHQWVPARHKASPLKKTYVLQTQIPIDKSHRTNSKATQVAPFSGEYKGNQVWERCEEQHTVRFTENRGEMVCLNSPVLASQLCLLRYPRLLWAEQNVALQRPHDIYFLFAAAIQTPLYPYSEKWFRQ